MADEHTSNRSNYAEHLGPSAAHANTTVFASVSDLNDLGDDVPWWRPSYGEIAALLPWWWWVLLALALGWIALFASATARGFMFGTVGLVFSLALPVWMIVTLLLKAEALGIGARRDPFCIFCGYSVFGIDAGVRCPECGRPCSAWMSLEYRKDPRFFRERFAMRRSHLREGAVLQVPRKPEAPPVRRIPPAPPTP
jgi:hypothetical protein